MAVQSAYYYDYGVVRPEFNLAPWLPYGRPRSPHTNAVIFAFGGSELLATSYCVVRRARLFLQRTIIETNRQG